MSGDTTYQALDRLTWLPNRNADKNGNVIAGQNYYDVLFTGGAISGVSIFDLAAPISIADGGTGHTTANTALNALLPNQSGQSGKILTTDGSNTSWASAGGGGTGTVTSVSVASANGFSGTVATATTTPAITISTSVTGITKGNGTVLSAAIAGTDYASPGANTDITSILLNQTGLVIKGATSNALTIKPNETLSAARVLNIITGDATRTLTFAGNATISGTNTGDQTITLTGDVTGSGTGAFAATIGANKVTTTTINANAVTNAKMATSTINTLAGYDNSGNFSDVSVGSGLGLSGGILTASGSGNAVSVVGATSWLNMAWNSNSRFSISTNDRGCVMFDGSTYINPTGSTIITVDITTSGLGGLDTGSTAANTWYYVWRVSDGLNINAYISLSYNSPTIIGAYAWIARIGVIRLDVSKNIVGFIQYDNNWWYQVGANLTGYPVLASSANTGSVTVPTYTTITTTSIVPPLAHAGVPVAGSIHCQLVTQIDGTAIVSATTSQGAYNSFTNPPDLHCSALGGAGDVQARNAEIQIISDGQLFWAALSGGSNTSYLFCRGFKLVL